MTDQAHAVHELVDQISAASQEQSTAAGLVTGAVETLDSATQRSATVVEKAAASAAVLKERAKELAGAVAVFRADEAPLTSTDTPPRPARAGSTPPLAAGAPRPGRPGEPKSPLGSLVLAPSSR